MDENLTLLKSSENPYSEVFDEYQKLYERLYPYSEHAMERHSEDLRDAARNANTNAENLESFMQVVVSAMEEAVKDSNRKHSVPKYALLPVDRVAKKAFETEWTPALQKSGIRVHVQKNGKRKDPVKVNVLIGFLFPDGSKLSRRVSNFEKRVYFELFTAAYVNKQTVISATQIYRAIYGDSKKPKGETLDAIRAAFVTLLQTLFTYDNEEEAIRYGRDRYKARKVQILQARIEEDRIVGGAVAKDALCLSHADPLKSFPLVEAIASRHILEKTPREALGLSRVDEKTLGLQDHIRYRVALMKRGNDERRINVEKLLDENGITRQRDRKTARKYIIEVVDNFKKSGHITNYSWFGAGETVLYIDPKKVLPRVKEEVEEKPLRIMQ